jgi:hypothetical protein
MNSHVEAADSEFKKDHTSIQVWHGGYGGLLFYTVAVILDTNVYHIGVARVNLNAGDQFSRKKGRKIAVGRALYQAAVFRGLANRRAKFVEDESGNFVKEGGGSMSAVSLPVGYQEPRQVADLAEAASALLHEVIPEFLFKQHLPKENPHGQ